MVCQKELHDSAKLESISISMYQISKAETHKFAMTDVVVTAAEAAFVEAIVFPQGSRNILKRKTKTKRGDGGVCSGWFTGLDSTEGCFVNSDEKGEGDNVETKCVGKRRGCGDAGPGLMIILKWSGVRLGRLPGPPMTS